MTLFSFHLINVVNILDLFYVCAHPVHVWCLWKSENGVRSPGPGVIDDCQTLLVLRAKPGSSVRVASVVNHRIISPAPCNGLLSARGIPPSRALPSNGVQVLSI